MALIAEKGLAVIQDEICRCGHSKRDHVGIFNHGECSHIGPCGCTQYTWDHFIVPQSIVRSEPDER